MPKPFHPDNDDVRVMIAAFERHATALEEAVEGLAELIHRDSETEENMTRARKDAERARRMARAMSFWVKVEHDGEGRLTRYESNLPAGGGGSGKKSAEEV